MARYRPVPVTQRDGSALQFSNCRLAAGATGIDGHTGGRVTSSGALMRARQGDQAGGTDALDLRTAWASYGELLSIPRLQTWADALADLGAGREVMIDVWHASAGGPCLSGSGDSAGAYGHTMIVHPERSGSDWLTSDPWCKPARWQWWPADKLQAGAEEWGRRLRRASGGGETTPALVRELFTRWRPDQPATGDDLDTGGPTGGLVRYTRTRVLATAGDDMPIVKFTPGDDVAGTLTVMRDTEGIPIEGGERPTVKAGIERPALGLFTLDDLDDRPCYLMGVGLQLCFIAVADVTFTADDGPNTGPVPIDDLASRQKQWDRDAAATIGPRPAT